MSKTIVFGTNGIRGNADQHPLTDDALHILGMATAKWAYEKYGKTPHVLMGSDTRISCPRIKKALIQGLQTYPLTIVDAGVIPTPTVCQLITYQQNFDFGVIVSASHNPYFDNGIKIFTAKTCILSKQDEQIIIQNFQDLSSTKKELVPHVDSRYKALPEAKDLYKQTITQFFPPQFLRGKKIILDCAHGATWEVAPEIFEHFGATVIPLAVHPDGKNINHNCGALHPERLQREVVAQKADAGFAFDGDGDRLVAVDKRGEVKEGDDILTLLLDLPEYEDISTVVATVMSNYGFELNLKKQGKSLTRTAVGDKYVAHVLQQQDLPLGGELSGHIIIKKYLLCGDGIFVALKVLEAMTICNNWDMKTFFKVPQVHMNIAVKNKKDLTSTPCCTIIKEHENRLEQGRLLVRYSGTENVLRIMTEAKEEGIACSVARSLADQLKVILNS